MNEANELIEKLKQHYKVATSQELAEKIGVAQTTVSGWKQRNSVNAVRRKIYELGLDIDLDNKKNIDHQLNNELENELLEKHIAYELRHKLYLDTASTFGNWLGHVVGMPVIHKALEEIGKGEYSKFDTKEKILNQIKGMELLGLLNKVFEKQNKNVASRYIERNLSELECYVWVKHYNIVTSYNKYWS